MSAGKPRSDPSSIRCAMRSLTASMQRHIAWIATGGTIAGAGTGTVYAAGTYDAETLLARLGLVPPLPLRPSEPYRIDSKDATPAHWRQLRDALQMALAAPDCAGAVISHGTDTLEETAAVLALTLPAPVPVVLTGAMHPADDPHADGPANLVAAFDLIARNALPAGVWLAFAGRVFAALGVRKVHTTALAAFADPTLDGEKAKILSAMAPPLLPFPDPWPEVALLPCTAWDDPNTLSAARARGAAAAVLLAPGNGSLPDVWHKAIRDAVHAGLCVVRASRCGWGAVTPHPLDEALGTVPAGKLSAAQARVAAAIVIAATNDPSRRRTLWQHVLS